jgi:phage terminase small subunit
MSTRTETKVQNPLNHKQQRFVHEYLIDLNATQAAIRAGYSAKTANRIGSENLSKPVIRAAIQHANQKRLNKLGIDAEWVLRNAVMLFEDCRKLVPVYDHEGNYLYDKPQDATNARGALEMIGKHIGVNAFKGADGSGNPIDQSIQVIIVDPKRKEKVITPDRQALTADVR